MLTSTIDVVNNNMRKRTTSKLAATGVTSTELMSSDQSITPSAVSQRPTPMSRDRGRRPVPQRRAAATTTLGELEDHLGYFIRRIQIWIFQDFIRALAAIDIRPAQYSVLVVVGANPGVTQKDVAEALGIERARMVHVLDKLEKRDLIERRRSPHDRRSHALHLTPEGTRTLRRAKALAAQHEARLTQQLGSREHRQLLQTLRRFRG